MNADLHEFARSRSADAFRRVVTQHVDAVYAHCLRRLDDPAAAEDATQAVFVMLARKASTLSARTVLGGWLYVTAQNVCHNARRAQSRRDHHERKAAAMRQEVSDASPAEWGDVRAVLDDAIAGLATGLRDAVVLRFLEGRSMAEIGQALGLSEEAARQRVGRAVKALREQLAGRGVALSAVALPAMLEANAKSVAVPRALVESSVAHGLAAPVAVATSGVPIAAGIGAILAGTAALSALVFAGQATSPKASANVRVAAGRGPANAAATMPAINAPAELVGTWRAATPGELIPREDKKRVLLMPVVVRGQEITIDTRAVDADGPADKRIVLHVIAATTDAEPKGIDATIVEMTRDGVPVDGAVGNIVPFVYTIDGDGLLHLTFGRLDAPEGTIVLKRDPPTTQP